MGDKPPDILRRIAEEQTDLMRELTLQIVEPVDQLHHTLICVLMSVSGFFQKVKSFLVGKILFQAGGTIKIYQNPLCRISQGQDPQSLGNKLPVQTSYLQHRLPPVCIRTGKEATSLDSRQCGGSVLNDYFIRHIRTPSVLSLVTLITEKHSLCTLLHSVFLQDAPQRCHRSCPGMFDLCIQTFDLVLRAFENFVRESACETDHQIRIAQLILQASGRFNKDFRTTFVFFTQILVLAFHTFIPAQYNHAHSYLHGRLVSNF